MSPERLLAWAEVVRKASEGEEETLEQEIQRKFKEGFIPQLPSFPPSTGLPVYDCNCPRYGTCMNTACPRRIQFTCGVGYPE